MNAVISAISAAVGFVTENVRGVAEWSVDALKSLCTSLFNLPSWFVSSFAYLGSFLVAAITLTGDIAMQFVEVIAEIGTMSGAMVGVGGGSPALGAASTIAATINTVIPLDEGCTFLGAMGVTVLTCATIRMVKACIPTIA
jgi:hypothetical protein